MSNFGEKLKAFLHDPVDKCFKIQSHIERAKIYAGIIGVGNVDEIKGPDWIASCMERSFLPEGILQDFNELRHPLSEGKINIPVVNPEDVFSSVERAFKQIMGEISGYDDEHKFIYIWRNLPEKLIEISKDKPWGKYLYILPADTRVPDHSIWEHLKIASAVNAYLHDNVLIQNNSLFLFSIGPVQSFISQARKTQDFFIGSFILSYLTFIGMEEILNKYGPTSIIYPDLFGQPLMDWFLEKKIKLGNSNSKYIFIPTIPNRFVAIIPVSDVNEIEKLAEGMKANIFNELSYIREKILEKLNLNKEGIREAIEKQFTDFPQIYWVAIPWRKGDSDVTIDDLKDFFPDDELNRWHNLWKFAESRGEYKPNTGLLYQLLYTALEKSIGMRKNLREFSQFEEAGRKCSVCGERNVIFFCETENKKKFIEYNPEAVDLTDRIDRKYLSDGEGLCGLCFIKRTFELYLNEKFYGGFSELSFPSTSEIALADFKERALRDAKVELEQYETLLKKILNGKCPVILPVPKLRNFMRETVDGEWFFEENLERESIKEELDVDLTGEQLDEIRSVLKKLTEKLGKPNSYYALIYLDGDNMGKWLSGEHLPGIENAYNSETWGKLPEDFGKKLNTQYPGKKILTPAIHASISNALRNYAIEFVREIVEEEHLGKLIYAGGDDLLAFVNLKDLLDVMEKLRFAFSGEIKIENGAIEIDFGNTTGFVEKNNVYLLTMGIKATASMGVVIAHYKEPLKIVINKVFEAKDKAKNNPGKDSFAILLMKRSGEERIAVYKWRYGGISTIKVIKGAKSAMDDGGERYISHGFIQKLKSEFMRLKNKDGHLSVTSDVFNTELLRLISRAYNYKGEGRDSENEKQRFIKCFHSDIVNLFWESGGNLDNFTSLLEIASFLNKGE